MMVLIGGEGMRGARTHANAARLGESKEMNDIASDDDIKSVGSKEEYSE
jgi:hypothetical protein